MFIEIIQIEYIGNTLVNSSNSSTLSNSFTDPTGIVQIHVAIVSINILVLVFAYEYSEGAIESFPNYLSMNEFWMAIITSSFLVSLLVYSPILFPTTGLELEVALGIWLMMLLWITAGATVGLWNRIIRLAKLTELELYKKEVEHLTRKLAVVGSRLKAAEQLLNESSTQTPTRTIYGRNNTAKITAKKVNISTGEYITDIDLDEIQNTFDRNLPLSGYFEVSLGHRVNSQEDVILRVLDDINENICREIADDVSHAIETKESLGYRVSSQEDVISRIADVTCGNIRDEIADDVSRAIKTKEYDSAFNFSYFSKEYEIVYEYIGELERASKESIDIGNFSKLNTHIHAYQELLRSLNLSLVGNSTEVQRRALHPILRSLKRLFVYWIENNSIDRYSSGSSQESIPNQYMYGIVDQTYMMGEKLRNGDFNEFDSIEVDEQTTSLTYFEDLLQYYHQEANTLELARYIQRRIDELDKLEQET